MPSKYGFETSEDRQKQEDQDREAVEYCRQLANEYNNIIIDILTDYITSTISGFEITPDILTSNIPRLKQHVISVSQLKIHHTEDWSYGSTWLAEFENDNSVYADYYDSGMDSEHRECLNFWMYLLPDKHCSTPIFKNSLVPMFSAHRYLLISLDGAKIGSPVTIKGDFRATLYPPQLGNLKRTVSKFTDIPWGHDD